MSTVADVIALTKPRLTALVLLTTAGGALLAPGPLPAGRVVLAVVGTALVVAAAHALNMLLERDLDARMSRTQDRPLPAGRLTPESARTFGLVLAAVSLPLLTVGVNVPTGALAALAFLSYVTVYTPLKRRSAWAVYVGAIPGALPPVLGWTAVTGSIDGPALLLFAVLFAWQIPHFLGLALYLEDQYAGAGVPVMPAARGRKSTVRQTRWWAGILLVVSLALVPAGLGGIVVAVAAPVLGVALVARSLRAPGDDARAWGRSVFLGSILYLSALFAALGIDALLR